MQTFTQRMDRTFRECPGAIAANLPQHEREFGTITIRSGMIHDALPFLRRRFHVGKELVADRDSDGIIVEIVPRARRYNTNNVRLRVSFTKPVQYELKL